jgi:hypothetical protein
MLSLAAASAVGGLVALRMGHDEGMAGIVTTPEGEPTHPKER